VTLRVLMTADPIGGVWTYACELAAALAPHGVQLTLATMGAPLSPVQAKAAAALPNVDVVESRFALEWMPEPWHDVDAAGEWLLAIERRTSPDVIHLNGYAHAALPFRAPVVAVAHSCVCTWYRAVRGLDAPSEWGEYRRRVTAGLRAADAVVAPTAAILRAILAEYELQVRGRVISNGRGAAGWQPAQKEPFVLAAGRLWDEAKGLDALDAAAPGALWPIHVAGPTTMPGGVRAGTPCGVRLLGELAPDALAAWAARAAIYVHPARYEPFGLSVVEAALAGCALVLSRLDSLVEVWGGSAYYVPPGEPCALASALDRLASDASLRRAFAASARSRALALTPARMADAYHALYRELTDHEAWS